MDEFFYFWLLMKIIVKLLFAINYQLSIINFIFVSLKNKGEVPEWPKGPVC